MKYWYLTLLSFFFFFSSQSQDRTTGCPPPSSSTFLEINNVRALIHNAGDMWWDLQGNPGYEVPKGSGKHSAFAGGIWIGGIDSEGQIHLAAGRYRSNGMDYFSGPLTNDSTMGTTNIETCTKYDRHFVTYEKEIREFVSWFNNPDDYPGYQIPESILEWPAHGNIAEGFSYYLAPFFDNDDNGVYNPYKGDYPLYDINNELPCGYYSQNYTNQLWGDQNLWWVFNDNGNIHTETDGLSVGLEVQAQAFAYADNSALNNTTFYNYRIINKSAKTYYDFYFGLWTDADLGYAYDDYCGSDVQRGMGYFYNGLPQDEGVPYAYGGPSPPPPSIGIDFIKGLEMDQDGLDNIKGCNEGINGLYFGDSIVDNESLGLSNFMYFGGHWIISDPGTASEYYSYLKSVWKDNTHMMYGGIGHPSIGSTTIPTNYMFPGNSDPCGYGQGGIPMPEWSEETEGNTPYDRRFVESTGPITFEPGKIQNVFMATVWDRAEYGNQYNSVAEMKRSDDIVQAMFDNCFRVTEGPEGPLLDIVQVDGEYIFMLINPTNSDNYLEKYVKADPKTKCMVSQDECDEMYRFQGYQVFQVKDTNITASQLSDTSLAKCVFQSDIQDDIADLVNYYYNHELETIYPEQKVKASNNGIRRSFTLKYDAFSGFKLDDKNNYYFVAVAYAYNSLKDEEGHHKYNPADPLSFRGQKEPYKPSSKTAGYEKLKVYQTNPEAVTVQPEIFFYPNPATDILYFNTNQFQEYKVEIFNLYGKKLAFFNIDPNNSRINTSGFSTGTYFLKISWKGFVRIEKLVIIQKNH